MIQLLKILLKNYLKINDHEDEKKLSGNIQTKCNKKMKILKILCPQKGKNDHNI